MAAVIQLLIEIDETGTLRGIAGIEGALTKVGQKGNVVFTGLGNDQRRAQQAAQLLGQQLGVHLPQALNQVLARSRLIGPALSSAFNVAVATAFSLAILKAIANFDEAKKKVVEFGTELDTALVRGLSNTLAFIPAVRELANELDIAADITKKLGEADAIRGETERLNREKLLVGLRGVNRLLKEQELLLADLDRAIQQAGDNSDKASLLRNQQKAQELISQNKINEAILAEAQAHAKAAQQIFSKLQQLQAGDDPFKKQQVAVSADIRALEELAKQIDPKSVAAQKALADAMEILNTQLRINALNARDAARAQMELQVDPRIAEGVLKRRQEENDLIRQTIADIDQLTLDQLQGIERIIAERDRELAKIEEIRQAHKDNAALLEQLANKEVLIRRQADIEIAEENRRRVEEMAGHWDRFIDRVIFGAESWKDFFRNMLKEMLGTFLKFIGRMIIAWITGLEKMKDIWESFKKSLPGGGGGIGINIGIGIGGTAPTFPGLEAFQHGGLVDDVLRRSQAIHSADGRLLAMLHQGEAVLNPGAVQLMGAGRIQALNRAGGGSGRPEFSGGVRSFQGGGFVGQPPVKSSGPVHIEINNINVPLAGMSTEEFADHVSRKTRRDLRRAMRDAGLGFATR